MEDNSLNIQNLIERQYEIIYNLQTEVIKEAPNAYTGHKVDNLVEATVALNNLTVAKNMLEHT